MPGKRNRSLKAPELYEKLREDGASKNKAARISNAAAKQGRSRTGEKGGAAGSYDDWTVADLRGRAKELGLRGYSGRRKSELISLLRNHFTAPQPLTPRLIRRELCKEAPRQGR